MKIHTDTGEIPLRPQRELSVSSQIGSGLDAWFRPIAASKQSPQRQLAASSRQPQVIVSRSPRGQAAKHPLGEKGSLEHYGIQVEEEVEHASERSKRPKVGRQVLGAACSG